MQRVLRPELLDSLPPDHPDARHSRRDLRLTNLILGNHRWFARCLPQFVERNERIVEIGAGLGELAHRLQAIGMAVDGLDLCPRPDPWPAAARWHQSPAQSFEGYGNYHVVIGNLIFHQFTREELASLGATLASTARVIVACEPARRRRSQALFRAIAPLFRANPVTLHDAHVSIAAGFRGHELPDLLGLDPSAWEVRCHATWLGAYRFVGIRRPARARSRAAA